MIETGVTYTAFSPEFRERVVDLARRARSLPGTLSELAALCQHMPHGYPRVVGLESEVDGASPRFRPAFTEAIPIRRR